jgi:hypothetical protein
MLVIVVHFPGITFALLHRVFHQNVYMVLVFILAICPVHRIIADFTTGVLTVLGDSTTTTGFLKLTRPHRYLEYFVLTFVGFCEYKTCRKLSY